MYIYIYTHVHIYIYMYMYIYIYIYTYTCTLKTITISFWRLRNFETNDRIELYRTISATDIHGRYDDVCVFQIAVFYGNWE